MGSAAPTGPGRAACRHWRLAVASSRTDRMPLSGDRPWPHSGWAACRAPLGRLCSPKKGRPTSTAVEREGGPGGGLRTAGRERRMVRSGGDGALTLPPVRRSPSARGGWRPTGEMRGRRYRDPCRSLVQRKEGRSAAESEERSAC
jgi:hypothetical protein